MTTDTRARSRPERAGNGRALFLAVIVAGLAQLLLADYVPKYAPGLLRFEHTLADVRTAYLSDQLATQHPGVAIVGITDQTLSETKARLPIDRALLANIVDAVDAAGAKAIGIDILFYRTAPADNEEMLIDALRRAKAKVVLAAADERLGLNPAQIERQARFFADAGRPAGYVNLATERDWVVRFKAESAPNSAFPKSFVTLLAQAAGYTPPETHRRIAWLRDPTDGSEAFFTVPAGALFGPADHPGVQFARAGLKDKIVIIGGLFPDIDQHVTPQTVVTHQKMAGAAIHAHILAAGIDGRSVGQLEANSLPLRLELAVLAFIGFLVGWYYRLKRKGMLIGSMATLVILAADTFVFWQARIILPIVLALLAWFIGEFSGHYLGRWIGHRGPDQSRWFVR